MLTLAARLHRVPKEFDVLKVDIDSIDLPICRAIIEGGYKPTIVMVEVNPNIPPPISFYATEFAFTKENVEFLHHGGASASALYHEMKRLDYALVGMELGSNRGNCMMCEHNMYFVRGDMYRAKSDGKPFPSHKEMSRSFWFALSQYWGTARSLKCYTANVCPTKQFERILCNQPNAPRMFCNTVELDRMPPQQGKARPHGRLPINIQMQRTDLRLEFSEKIFTAAKAGRNVPVIVIL
jgi:hypothetical protein